LLDEFVVKRMKACRECLGTRRRWRPR